ncbi:MAG TPA: hypothetical protein VNQ77_13870 [Frankiaceae bacterium]|nr:hypothetical protein [Frankiaceae bacterium]
MSKLARLVAAAAVAAAPVLALASPAQAANGCAVNNTGSSTSNVTITVTPTGANPITIGHSSSAISCSYITATDAVTLTCTLTGGRCVAYVNGVQSASCIDSGNATCSTNFHTTPGDTITLEVVGGRGEVSDYVA